MDDNTTTEKTEEAKIETPAPKVVRRRSVKPVEVTKVEGTEAVDAGSIGETQPETQPEEKPAEEAPKPPPIVKRKASSGGVAVTPATPKPPKELAPIAKEVNVRLEKASKLESDAQDHRLAAALKLAEAKEICKRAGISFKTWAEENVKDGAGNQIGFQAVRKLANIGEKDDPEEELNRQREAQAERAKASRDKKAAEVEALKEAAGANDSGGDQPKPNAFEPAAVKERDPALLVKDLSGIFERLPDAATREDAIRDLFAFLSPAEALAALKSVADDLGCKVVAN